MWNRFKRKVAAALNPEDKRSQGKRYAIQALANGVTREKLNQLVDEARVMGSFNDFDRGALDALNEHKGE